MSLLHVFGLETLLALGYAAFLSAAAYGFEAMGRVAHKRTEQYETKGFRYHAHFDRFECPNGSFLKRVAEARAGWHVRYRAPAHHCNGCPRKGDCTDSHRGREIVRSSVPWLDSAIGRFHHGLSLALLVLASLVLALTAFVYADQLQDRVVLAVFFAFLARRGVAVVFELMRSAAET